MQQPVDRSELILVVITAATTLPELHDDEGWAEADRLHAIVAGLQGGGYRVAGVLPADAQLPERLAALAPDMLVVDAESGARDAVEHVVWATRDAPRPIVLFTDEHDPSHMREAVASGVVAYVVDGLAAERVRSVIDVAVARSEHEQSLKAELAAARDKLRERELIDRAKALLITKHGLSEPEAYARLRSTAMNRGLTIAEVAGRLLDLADLLA